MFYLYTKFQVSSFNTSFVVAIKARSKENICMVALVLFHIPLKYDFNKDTTWNFSTVYAIHYFTMPYPVTRKSSIAVLFHDTAMCSVVQDASYMTKDFKPNTRYFTQVYQHKNK